MSGSKTVSRIFLYLILRYSLKDDGDVKLKTKNSKLIKGLRYLKYGPVIFYHAVAAYNNPVSIVMQHF